MVIISLIIIDSKTWCSLINNNVKDEKYKNNERTGIDPEVSEVRYLI